MSYAAPKTGKLLLLTVAGVLVITPVARWIGKTAAEAQNAREAAANPQAHGPTWLELNLRTNKPESGEAVYSTDVKTMVSRQSADGVTQADMNPKFLQNLETWTLQRTRANAQAHWDEANVPESERLISAESTYVSAGSQRLAIIRIRIGDVTPVATVFGVVGSEAIRVMCIVDGERDVPVSSGACDDKVKEVFGTSMNPLKNSRG